VQLGEIGSGREREGDGLADSHDVGVGAHVPDEVHEIEGVVLHVELALRDGNVAGVVPVGDPDLAVHEQALDRGAQERGVVTRHRRDEQDAAGAFGAAHDAEADQVAEGALELARDRDDMIAPVLAHDVGDVPVGFHDHPCEGAFGHLAPCGHDLKRRMRHEARCRVGGERLGRRAKPLVGVAHRLVEVVGEHVAHGGPFSVRAIPGQMIALPPGSRSGRMGPSEMLRAQSRSEDFA
jgi:hypothetical protein